MFVLLYLAIGLIVMLINLRLIVLRNDKPDYMSRFKKPWFWIEQILVYVIGWGVTIPGAFIVGCILYWIDNSKKES